MHRNHFLISFWEKLFIPRKKNTDYFFAKEEKYQEIERILNQKIHAALVPQGLMNGMLYNCLVFLDDPEELINLIESFCSRLGAIAWGLSWQAAQ